MEYEKQLLPATDEKSSTATLLKYLRNLPNSWFYKIPDIGKKTKPFDIIGVIDGQSILMELKYVELKTVHQDYCEIIYRSLEPHQASNLYKVQLAGGISIIGWYIKALNRFIFYPFSCHQLRKLEEKH